MILSLLVLAVLPVMTSQSAISGADLGSNIRRIAEEALGISKIQEVFDKYATFTLQVPDGHKIVQTIAEQLSAYIKISYKKVQNNHDAILSCLNDSPDVNESFPMNESAKQCCDVETQLYEPYLGRKINRYFLCVKRPMKETVIGPVCEALQESYRRNYEYTPRGPDTTAWQFYATERGAHFTYPSRISECTGYDPRIRPWYNAARSRTAKDIVIVVDLTTNGDVHLRIKAAHVIIQTTSYRDRLAVVIFCGRRGTGPIGGVKGTACFSSNLAVANAPNIELLLKFLSSQVSKCNTSKTAYFQRGLQKGFNYFEGSSNKVNKLLVFLTGSNPDDAPPSSNILKKAKELNNKFHKKVIILTFGFGALMTKTGELLRKLAESTNYTTNGQEYRGFYTHISNGTKLRLQMRSLFNTFPDAHPAAVPYTITAPYVDASGLGLIVSVCMPVLYHGVLQGVTGTDMKVEEIFLNVTYYQQGLDAYMFIVNSEGRAIIHPLLPKPSAVVHEPVSVSIQNLERDPEVQQVIQSMVSGGSGNKTFYSHKQNKGEVYDEHNAYRQVASHYYWTKVNDSDFSICLVYTDRDGKIKMTLNKKEKASNYLHPLKIHEKNLCQNQGITATKDHSTVRFNGTAYKLLPSKPDDLRALTVNAFLTENAIDQGLEFKNTAQSEVIITGKADDIWKRPPQDWYSAYVMWRILAMPGTIRVYPGAFYRSFNPSLQRWYQNAVDNRGQIVFTRVRKAKQETVMMSTAILMGNAKGEHSDFDLPVAVVAGEFSSKFFYLILENTFDLCRQEDAVCFLVDDEGYVLVHKDYTSPDTGICHLITMEPDIADVLREENHLKPKKCLDLEHYREIHSWKLSLNEWIVKSNSPPFELRRVPGTNTFVGITWRSREQRVSSCSTATLSRCRVTPSVGHSFLPCYDTLDYNYCKNSLDSLDQKREALCTIVEDIFDPMKMPEGSRVAAEVCFQHQCDRFTREGNCQPETICSWCSVEGAPAGCHNASSCRQMMSDNIHNFVESKVFLYIIIGVISMLFIVALLYACFISCRKPPRVGDNISDVYEAVELSRQEQTGVKAVYKKQFQPAGGQNQRSTNHRRPSDQQQEMPANYRKASNQTVESVFLERRASDERVLATPHGREPPEEKQPSPPHGRRPSDNEPLSVSYNTGTIQQIPQIVSHQRRTSNQEHPLAAHDGRTSNQEQPSPPHDRQPSNQEQPSPAHDRQPSNQEQPSPAHDRQPSNQKPAPPPPKRQLSNQDHPSPPPARQLSNQEPTPPPHDRQLSNQEQPPPPPERRSSNQEQPSQLLPNQPSNQEHIYKNQEAAPHFSDANDSELRCPDFSEANGVRNSPQGSWLQNSDVRSMESGYISSHVHTSPDSTELKHT